MYKIGTKGAPERWRLEEISPFFWEQFLATPFVCIFVHELLKGNLSIADPKISAEIEGLSREFGPCFILVEEGAGGFGTFHVTATWKKGDAPRSELHTIFNQTGEIIAQFILGEKYMRPEGV